MMVELLPKYILDDKELCFEIEECLVNGNLTYPDNHEILNLKMVSLVSPIKINIEKYFSSRASSNFSKTMMQEF